ncbi:hypothetical protein ACLBWP_03505 [Microbacterium sp. M1A1_1b]
MQRLREYGIGVNRIEAVARFPMIQNLVYGVINADGVRVPMQRVSVAKANRLLAIRPTFDLIADGARLSSRGTHRRVQALVYLGWSQLELSRRLNLATNEVNRILTEPHVTGRTHRAVAALYEQLWNTEPPQDTPSQRTSVTKARALARRKGWHPALAWDDIDLDDRPAAPERVDGIDETAVLLAVAGEQVRLTPEERRAAVRQLHAAGLSDGSIAARIHCTDRTVLRIRHDELHLPANSAGTVAA